MPDASGHSRDDRRSPSDSTPPRSRPSGLHHRILGYSRFVGTMRWTLPLAALVLILLVILWPQFRPDDRKFRIGFADLSVQEAERDQVLNPRFTGFDKDDQPFTLVAKLAIRQTRQPDLIDLEAPQADITLKNGSWLAMTADKGVYDQAAQVLHLEGDVNLFHDDGYQFTTSSARIDLRRGTAMGDEAVTGHGPSGRIQSQGFAADNNRHQLVFTGKARLVMYLSEGKKGSVQARDGRR